MNVSDMVRAMRAVGCSPELIVAAVEQLDEAPAVGSEVRRQARNARYYQARLRRLKTSEIKTTETSETVLIKTPLARVEDNLLTLEGTGLELELRSSEDKSSSDLVDVTVDKTPPRKQIQRLENDEKLLDEVTDAWNAWAISHRCPQVKFLTKSRGMHCRQRLKDIANGEEPAVAFRKVLSKCETSFFVRGSPRSPLKFDQLMREGFLSQMLEGAFEYQGANQWRK